MELTASFSNLGMISNPEGMVSFEGRYSPSHFIEIVTDSIKNNTLRYSRDKKKIYIPFEEEVLYIILDMSNVKVVGKLPNDAEFFK